MGNSESDQKAQSFFKDLSKGVTKGVGEIGKFATGALGTIVGGGPLEGMAYQAAISPVIDGAVSGLNGLYKSGGRVHGQDKHGSFIVSHPQIGKNIIVPKGSKWYKGIRSFLKEIKKK